MGTLHKKTRKCLARVVLYVLAGSTDFKKAKDIDMKKGNMKRLLVVFTGIPATIIIVLIIWLNFSVFAPVPDNNYYAQTHTKVHNLSEALKISENKLPIEKLRTPNKNPVFEEYILEHTYGLPIYKESLSFSINICYSNDNSDMINIYIPLCKDSRNDYLFNNYYCIDDADAKKTEEEIYSKNKIIKIYRLLPMNEDKSASHYDSFIINFKNDNIEYFIKSSTNNSIYAFEIIDNLS